MEPMLNQPSRSEMTSTLLRNPITRKAMPLGGAYPEAAQQGASPPVWREVRKDRPGGVPVKQVTGSGIDADPRLLINFHGLDSGSLTDSIG
jgi:hypothetical protein